MAGLLQWNTPAFLGVDGKDIFIFYKSEYKERLSLPNVEKECYINTNHCPVYPESK